MQRLARLIARLNKIILALTALPSLAQSTYTPYTITTLAGTTNSGSADGKGSSASFNAPSGIALDAAGNIYVADLRNHAIRRVTSAGVVTTLAGLPGISGSADGTGSDARFKLPSALDVDGAGNLYVADSGNSTIRKVTPMGTNWVVTTLAGLAGSPGNTSGTGSAARFNAPQGLAVDSASNVYVGDWANNLIRKITPEGLVTTLAGSGFPGSKDGTGSAASFSNPSGVAVDGGGNAYVADWGNYEIRKITPVGVVTTLAGASLNAGSRDGPGNTARFGLPNGVLVDGTGTLFVADSGNSLIRKMAPVGTNWVVTTMAGLPRISGSADGTGSAALFDIPQSLAMDKMGNLYVVDQYNNEIRKGYPENVPAMIVTSGPGFGFVGGSFSFNLTGPAGQLLIIEASDDMMNWLPIWTNTFAGELSFTDPQIGGYFNRFYRARTP